jgi:hypothetical protein
MNFILVNGRTPRRQSFCALCGEPIGASYLRETGTQLYYCDHDCYADHCDSAVTALATHASASMVALAPNQVKARSEAELTAKQDPAPVKELPTISPEPTATTKTRPSEASPPQSVERTLR